jgi:predicted nucleic acid-binding protein
VRISLDTNILIYAADEDAGDKRPLAQEIVQRAAATKRCVLALQVLAEFYNVASRRRSGSVKEPEVLIADWRRLFPVVAATENTLDEAINAVKQHGLAFWDAMLWASAKQAGCAVLLSEDFQDGRRLGPVTFVNPFDPKNTTIIDHALVPLSDQTE